MSTIAYRDGIMAADSLCVGADTRWGEVEKIIAGDGCMGGAVGPAAAAASYCRWITDRCTDDDMYFGDAFDDAEGLLVLADRTIWCWSGKRRLFKLDTPFTAIGSGAKIAMGAMAMGASAEKAVQIASQFDVYTGGRITTLALDQPSRPKQEAK